MRRAPSVEHLPKLRQWIVRARAGDVQLQIRLALPRTVDLDERAVGRDARARAAAVAFAIVRACFERAHQALGEITSRFLKCFSGLIEHGLTCQDVALHTVRERSELALLIVLVSLRLLAREACGATTQIDDAVLS
jgi:hypothetical protein